MLKVAFIARSSLHTDSGGDTVQILKTAEELRKLKVQVDVFLAHEKVDASKYDLLHLFNVIRPADFLKYLSQKKTPIALSTIYVNYAETDKLIRKDTLGKLAKIFGANALEYFKTIAKWLLKGERIESRSYLFLGHKRSVQKLLREADILLPNSASEMRRIEHDYEVKNRFAVIPNAVEESLTQVYNAVPWNERFGVLSVGRIEPRKNQLNLIHAANALGVELTIIGKPGVNHQSYYKSCMEAAGPTISFKMHLPFSEVKRAYQNAKVHVLPSWFETTGLSSLEASALGCNIIVTRKGDTEEYFQNDAIYCEPNSVESIKSAIQEALEKPLNERFIKRIQENYTWKITAEKTLAAYREILNSSQL